MTLMTTIMLFVVLPLLSISIVLSLVRLIHGPDIADRVIALDLISTIGISFTAAYAITANEPAFLDVAIILAVLGFLGTIAFAYYIEQRRG